MTFDNHHTPPTTAAASTPCSKTRCTFGCEITQTVTYLDEHSHIRMRMQCATKQPYDEQLPLSWPRIHHKGSRTVDIRWCEQYMTMSTVNNKCLYLCTAMTRTTVSPVQYSMHPVISQGCRSINCCGDEFFLLRATHLHPNITSHDMLTQLRCFQSLSVKYSKVKYTSICIAHRRNYLKCTQTWITQCYLQSAPCLPLLPSHRASLPFGWYSFYRPMEG